MPHALAVAKIVFLKPIEVEIKDSWKIPSRPGFLNLGQTYIVRSTVIIRQVKKWTYLSDSFQHWFIYKWYLDMQKMSTTLFKVSRKENHDHEKW